MSDTSLDERGADPTAAGASVRLDRLRRGIIETGAAIRDRQLAAVAPRPVHDAAAADEERDGVGVTWGSRPRFLHSTGRFHKGGPPAGHFLQLVYDDSDPGRPSTFRKRIDAQSDGDLRTLRDNGLPAERARLPAGDPAGAITRLQEQL